MAIARLFICSVNCYNVQKMHKISNKDLSTCWVVQLLKDKKKYWEKYYVVLWGSFFRIENDMNRKDNKFIYFIDKKKSSPDILITKNPNWFQNLCKKTDCVKEKN